MKRFVVVLGLCLALLSTAAGCVAKADSSKIDTQIGVSALAALADSHIESYVVSMAALAATREVQSGDWGAMRPLLEKVARPETAAKVGRPENAAAVWYVLPDGSYFTVEQGKQSANISDRPYFPRLMARNIITGDLVVSRSTGRKSAVVAVPVVKDGKVVGGLGSSVFLEDLSATLRQELGLPDNMVFYAVTDRNEVALHSDTAMIMAASPALAKNVEWRASPLTGWRFALGTK
ncbi:MAG: cache domain-containing protein [Chloroflexi bacterium]|nr:cache domain-containing protein [Chloroflexota bacterium]